MADRSMRSLVHLECRALMRALASTREVHASIHEARKAIRRLRALLALVAGAHWKEIGRVDRALQRLGDGFSALRDAHVAVGTAQSLARMHATWSPVVAELIAQRDALVHQLLEDDVDFLRRRDDVAHLDGTLDDLPWETLDAEVLRDGLKRSRRRVANAQQQARHDPTLDKLHRWRRRARRLRMQLNAVGDAQSASEAKLLHKIGDRLGALQDLRMLRKRLRQMPGVPNRDDMLRQLRKRIDSRRSRF